MSPAFPQQIRTLSVFHRALLIFCLPMFLLGAWATFTKSWDNAAALLASGDVPRFWLNRVAAVVACLGCLSMDALLLHLLFKRVTITEEGVMFTGLIRRSLRWTDVKEAKIVVEQHTTSLQLRSVAGKRYEIGIGDRYAAEVCQGVVAAVSELQRAPNKKTSQPPEPTRFARGSS